LQAGWKWFNVEIHQRKDTTTRTIKSFLPPYAQACKCM